MNAAPVYRERLAVPLRWWVQGVMLLATFWLAFVVSMPAYAAWLATAVLVGLMTLLFVGFGSATLEVRDGLFVAGRARIGPEHLGEAEALDATATRLAAGRDADARAYLLLRPYLKRSVRVRIEDPADPTPYWLVGTRRPEELVAALTALRAAGSAGGGNDPATAG